MQTITPQTSAVFGHKGKLSSGQRIRKPEHKNEERCLVLPAIKLMDNQLSATLDPDVQEPRDAGSGIVFS